MYLLNFITLMLLNKDASFQSIRSFILFFLLENQFRNVNIFLVCLINYILFFLLKKLF